MYDGASRAVHRTYSTCQSKLGSEKICTIFDKRGSIVRDGMQDLRTQCRQRKLSPAGGREQLAERLKEDMLSKNDLYGSVSLKRVILSVSFGLV
jgi:hypothetical protein